MAERRALIIAPLYDGSWLPPLSGSPTLVNRLSKCLRASGAYDIRVLDGIVKPERFREVTAAFFDSPGELLLYFYGHGCIGSSDLGYFATSDSAPYREGVLMLEIGALVRNSRAAEIVLIYDCCHAGKASVTNATLSGTAKDLEASVGRDLLAACAAHQIGWETENKDHKQLGAFSAHILEGLEGAAVPRGSSSVRGSALGEYVTRQFRRWGQDPIAQCKETGTHHCVITSGFSEQFPHLGGQGADATPARILGAPFKPSQVFVGRSAELERLVETLVAGDRPIAVSATVEGLGGIGKTELVLHLIHHPRILHAYDFVVWLDGAGPLAPQWDRLALEAGVVLQKKRPRKFVEALAKGFANLGRVLVVLDNATDWSTVSAWIPVEFPLLVTTRTKDFGGNRFIHTELDVLSQEAALQFLAAMIPDSKDDPHLERLVEEIGGHVLALELAGWNMKYLGIPPQEYLVRLKKHARDAELAISATRYGDTVEGCLSITWNSLRHDSSRTLWRRASLFAPTSAHRDLLKISALGDNDSRYNMRRLLEYLQRHDGEDMGDSELAEARADVSAILEDEADFDSAYAELRAFHVLARVEGYNGERWAMHRLVRDFGRTRVRKREIMLHGMALSEWLRRPTLPLRPEVPHFVATILDAARQQEYGDRFFARELSHRSRGAFGRVNSRYFIEFIRDELSDPKALTLILGGLSDVNEDVRVEAIRLLEEIGPIPEVLTALQATLDDPDVEVRRRAAATLAKYGTGKTIKILSEAIGSPNSRARLTAVEALGLMGEQAHPVLVWALKNDDVRIQAEAALILGEQGRKEGVPVLLARLEAASGRQAERIIESLGNSGDDRAYEALVKLLGSATNRVRAVNAIAKIGGSRAHLCLQSLLADSSDEVRCAALQALDAAGLEDGVKKAIDVLGNHSIADGARFPGLVSMLAEKRNISLPIEADLKLLKDSSWQVRANCATRLGHTKASGAVESLIEALGDDDYDVRREVARSLGLIGDARALESLRNVALKDSRSDVKSAAVVAMEQIKEISSNGPPSNIR